MTAGLCRRHTGENADICFRQQKPPGGETGRLSFLQAELDGQSNYISARKFSTISQI